MERAVGCPCVNDRALTGKSNRFLNELCAIGGQAEKIIADQSGAVVSLIAKHQKPLIGYSFLTRQNPFIRRLQDIGVPVLPSPERAARAVGALATYLAYRNKIIGSKKPQTD